MKPKPTLAVLIIAFLSTFSAYHCQASIPDSVAQKLGDSLRHYLSNNQIDSALSFTGKLMRHYKLEGNREEELRAAIHRAEVLRSINSLEEAQIVLRDYRSLAERLDFTTVKSTYYNRLGAILYEAKKKDLALRAINRSMEIDSIKGYKWRVFSNLNLKGAIYRDRGDLNQAAALFRKTADYAQYEKDTAEYLSALYNLALTLQRQEKCEECIQVCLEYIKSNPFQGLEKTVGDMWHIAAMCAREIEAYEKAYNYLDSAHKVRLDEMQRIIDSRVDAFTISNQLEQERLKSSVLEAEKGQAQFRVIALTGSLLVSILIVIIIYLSRQRYKSHHKEQRRLNEEMQKTLSFKNNLIGIVAHDIRNPMASLKGMLQVFNQGLVEKEELKEWMDGLEVSVANVDLLLENLLNWVRSQSDAIEMRAESLDLSLLIQKCLKELEAQVKLKQIKIEWPENSIEHMVQADANILSFVLRNVLSNALKYSPENSTVVLSCHDHEQEHVLSVKDQGSGIKPEQLELIRNHQAISSDGTASERGTGMGLSLSIEFLEAMGASLEINSTLGEGTEVLIHIPR